MAKEKSERRSFLKGVAGAVTAGALASESLSAEVGPGGVEMDRNTKIDGTRRRVVLRIAFDKQRPPALAEVVEALEKTLVKSGCFQYGFDRVDIRLRLEEILGPDPMPWVATRIGGEEIVEPPPTP